jgi:hypothetical protein
MQKCEGVLRPDGTFWDTAGIQIMFVLREWIKRKGEEKELHTHDGKFATYHEATERAKEIGPACFPQLETEQLDC